MNTHARRLNLAAATLAIIAGTTAVALAQDTQDRHTNTTHNNTQGWSTDFRSCHKVLGGNVSNAEGKHIAEITDIVIDRGSGRAEYAVLRTGDILGLGGKTVAVPYASLNWTSDESNPVRLDTTAEALKQYPTFTPEEWTAMMESRKNEDRVLYDRFSTPTSAESTDPYHGSLADSKRVTVKGKVQSVERIDTTTYGEQVIVTVNTDDGTTRRVALGPSWYLGGSAVNVYRGDTIEVQAYDMPRDSLVTAANVKVNGRDVQLREDNGNPMWALRQQATATKPHASAAWRYALLSNVRGMKVDCRGTECGKVSDIIFERNSGQIGFLSIDPNENFLGIADTKRLVPWSIASVSLEGTVRIDASKDMVVASPETPKDYSTLNQRTSWGRVYDAYQVPAFRFEPRSHIDPAPPVTSAWAADGTVYAAIERGSERTIHGDIVDFSQQSFDAGVDTASTMKVRTNDGTETVLLGPEWYLARQSMAFKKGDPVSIETSRTTINGKPYLIARSVKGKSTNLVLWNGRKPVWNER